MKLTGKKLILLLLYAPTDCATPNIPVAGRTRLMKMGFLFREELLAVLEMDLRFEEVALPEFFAWKYGPFSTQLLNDLEFLINQEYVLASSGSDPLSADAADAVFSEYEYWVEDVEDFRAKEYTEEVFSLTDRGQTKAEPLWGELSDNQRRLLQDFKRALCRAPLDRILAYVYKKYRQDGYADKSLIRERYLF